MIQGFLESYNENNGDGIHRTCQRKADARMTLKFGDWGNAQTSKKNVVSKIVVFLVDGFKRKKKYIF